MRINENYFFIHNVYAHFFDDTLNYFANYLYPRFHHQVVGTYDKAVEYINKKVQYNNEHDMPNLPAIILNPSGEFQIADANAGGQQLWRFPNISGGNPDLKLRLYDPIYQDDHIRVNPIYCRIKGEIELIMLLNSFYEYCDMKMFVYQIFGGMSRPIYPSMFRTFLIIPDELLNYHYTNPVDGSDYLMNWETAGAYETLVRTTNRNEIVVPVNILPRYTLSSMSDASMKYGGVDNLADWRLSVSLEYEIEMPWYVYMKTDYLAEKIECNLSVSSYMGSKNNIIQDANHIDKMTHSFDWNLPSDEHGVLLDEKDVLDDSVCEKSEWNKDGFYYYEFTTDDITNLSVSNITDGIVITTRLNEDNKLFIQSKYGTLTENIDYTTEDAGTRDTLIRIITNTEDENVVWKENDILEIYSFNRVL